MSASTEMKDGLKSHEGVEIKNEHGEKTVEQNLAEVEYMIGQLEESGVPTESGIAQEHGELETDFGNTLSELKTKLGEENISKESEGMIHAHVVDEVVAFREKVLDKYNNLLKTREELKESKDVVLEAAREARTVRDFKNTLASEASKEGANTDVKEAATNISNVIKNHGAYKVKEDLPAINGVKTAGITKMGKTGGGEIIIDAEHLATIDTEEGKIEVNKTLEHEEIHGNQTRLQESNDGTVVVDPSNNRKMSEAELFEGGAVVGTEHLGGQDDTLVADVYKQGTAFYKRNGTDIINEHVNKDGEHAGDRVHLQAALAKETGVTDEKKILELAKKSGFSEIETMRFLKLMIDEKEKVKEENSPASLAA